MIYPIYLSIYPIYLPSMAICGDYLSIYGHLVSSIVYVSNYLSIYLLGYLLSILSNYLSIWFCLHRVLNKHKAKSIIQIYSDVMKTIQCAHPPHHHNGFVATCRLWTASGGVHALLVLEPTECSTSTRLGA